MSELLKIATSQLGQKEISGPEDNPAIVNYAKEIGLSWINDDETPWCSVFVGWCALKAGLSYSKSALARSWLHIGTPVNVPEPGDVVVFWRESLLGTSGHVGFFMGYSQDLKRIYCLGGNQGNQVSISAQSAERLLGFRRLAKSAIISLPEGVLRKGDTGEKVVQLQDAMKAANYEVGTSDGVFGAKMDAAIKLLQANGGLKADGVYGPKTKNLLNTILNA